MKQQGERWVGRGTSEAERRLIARIVREGWSRASGRLDADLRRDCEVMAELALWSAQQRQGELPEVQRERYVATCLRHAVYHFLAVELQHSRQEVSLAELAGSVSNHAMELAEEGVAGREAFRTDPLVAQIEREELAAAVRALSARERLILDLHFVVELSDAEIAQRLNVKREAVRQQRHRAIGKLRKMLGAEGD